MIVSKLILKIRKRLWKELVKRSRNKAFYFYMYRSYWHLKLNKATSLNQSHLNFYTAIPNRGAGIGHQLANWISGYWYAKKFGLNFAHTPFSTERWESFLGFGEGEQLASELVSQQQYKEIRLPLFDENDLAEIETIKAIISSYSGHQVVFVAEQDQPYQDLFGVIDDLRLKFYSAKSRKDDTLIFSEEYFNIALHIRRGDIVIGQTNDNLNLKMRWQDNKYFEDLLQKVIENIKTDKPIKIFLFSQGSPQDFEGFNKFDNINLCLEMGAQESFLHMVFADLLITSKSSFSYKPALLNKGIKICPSNFWHNYPTADDWILVDDHGNFNIQKLNINK